MCFASFSPNLAVLDPIGGDLSRVQAKNRVYFDFYIKLDLKGQI